LNLRGGVVSLTNAVFSGQRLLKKKKGIKELKKEEMKKERKRDI